MFREMRRKHQHLPDSEISQILNTASSGVLALHGDDGYPYAVPLSFAYYDGKIYFHSAKCGHKIDAINKNCKASFCIIESDNISQETFTTLYKSVILFGRASIINDENEIRTAVMALADKYSPDMDKASKEDEYNRFVNSLCVIRFDIEHADGKEGKALAENRRKNNGAI